MIRDTTHYSGCGARHVECWLRAQKWKQERYALGDPAAVRHVEKLLAENERLRDRLREGQRVPVRQSEGDDDDG